VVVALGDSAVGTLERCRLAGERIFVVFASSARSTIEALQGPGGPVGTFPGRAFAVELDQPGHGGLSPTQRAYCFTDAPHYYKGGADGASTRADAALRVAASVPLERALRAALDQAHANRQGTEHLSVRVLVVATAYRMTGSGGVVPLVALVEDVLGDYEGQADHVVDVLLATGSVNLADERSRRAARQGRTSAVAELGLATEHPEVAGPRAPRPMGELVGHVYELGAPVGSGRLGDEAEAGRALALALRTLLFGEVAAEREAARPHSRDVTWQPDGTRALFAGMGALEVAYDAATARAALAGRLLGTMPLPSGQAKPRQARSRPGPSRQVPA
jgi:hypothetical protein